MKVVTANKARSGLIKERDGTLFRSAPYRYSRPTELVIRQLILQGD